MDYCNPAHLLSLCMVSGWIRWALYKLCMNKILPLFGDHIHFMQCLQYKRLAQFSVTVHFPCPRFNSYNQQIKLRFRTSVINTVYFLSNHQSCMYMAAIAPTWRLELLIQFNWLDSIIYHFSSVNVQEFDDCNVMHSKVQLAMNVWWNELSSLTYFWRAKKPHIIIDLKKEN